MFDSRRILTVGGPSDGKEVKYVFGRPGARVGVGSVCKRPLTFRDVWCPAAGLYLETGQLSRHFIAEKLNVTLNHNQHTSFIKETALYSSLPDEGGRHMLTHIVENLVCIRFNHYDQIAPEINHS